MQRKGGISLGALKGGRALSVLQKIDGIIFQGAIPGRPCPEFGWIITLKYPARLYGYKDEVRTRRTTLCSLLSFSLEKSPIDRKCASRSTWIISTRSAGVRRR